MSPYVLYGMEAINVDFYNRFQALYGAVQCGFKVKYHPEIGGNFTHDMKVKQQMMEPSESSRAHVSGS